ncbi:MAG: transporter, partial [Elusimicrobiota bacterium]
MYKKIPTHILVASSAWVSKVIISLIQLFIMKNLIQILGEEKYSVYAILTGLIGWFALFDFGIGTSLQNYISEYRANNKNYN